MIKTTIACNSAKPNEATSLQIIELVASYTMSPTGVNYDVEHFALLEGGAKVTCANTKRLIPIPQYNQFSQAVDAQIVNFDTSEMTAFEIEQLRVKIGLFIYVTQVDLNPDGTTAYNIQPNQWELS